jgi:hypothetical protein
MYALFNHPAVQAVLAPFIVALLFGLLLRRFGVNQFMGVAVLAGFLTSVILSIGFTWQPLTSTRKIILASLCLPFVVLLCSKIPTLKLRLRSFGGRSLGWALPAVGLVAALIWVLWPLLMRQSLALAWPMLAWLGVYVTVIAVFFLIWLQPQKTRGAPALYMGSLALAVGTGLSCLLAASALYAQLAFAIAAGVVALVVLHVYLGGKWKASPVSAFTAFAIITPLALLGAAATVFAQLPQEVLWSLALVPLFSGIIPVIFAGKIRVGQQWLATGSLAFIPAIIAVWLAWDALGAVSF